MSEDEGTNPAAHGVSSEEVDEDADPSTTEGKPEDGPETSEDVQEVLDRVTAYDDELARDVNSIVETAQDLHGTVNDQREELEDLRERIDEQAETIGDLQDQLDERENALEEANAEIEELESALKRKQADFQNYKKRAKKRQKQLKERATEDLVGRLVGVRDNLKRALEEEGDDVDSLRDGLEMTLREFDRILEDENVEEIDPEPGTDVDPQRHEVMMTVDSALPEGAIDEVYRPGYEMAEKVIQNAQVTVSNGELEGDEEDEEDEPTSDAPADDQDDEPTSEEDDEAIELGGEVAPDEGETDEPNDDTDDEAAGGEDDEPADEADEDLEDGTADEDATEESGDGEE